MPYKRTTNTMKTVINSYWTCTPSLKEARKFLALKRFEIRPLTGLLSDNRLFKNELKNIKKSVQFVLTTKR